MTRDQRKKKRFLCGNIYTDMHISIEIRLDVTNEITLEYFLNPIFYRYNCKVTIKLIFYVMNVKRVLVELSNCE